MCARKSSTREGRNVRLKPADSFDLIRLLAQTQSDPRKAVGELVQNSLDADARHVDVTWLNEKHDGRRVRVLRILDDGRGIFPELGREDALRRIATTIGHSYKRDLTLSERRELMLAGKYGIGLLGFWSVGTVMEIRSRVDGGEVWTLRLRMDAPDAQLLKTPQRRLHELETFTEIAVIGVHEGADSKIRPVRLQAYLASELRGQLLERDVEIRIHDRVSRGRAPKELRVQAVRYRGRPLRDLRSLPVPGHEDARVDLYIVLEEDRHGRVALACTGTTVLDDLAGVDGTGEPRPPWSSGRLEGVVDFADLEVVPGTRRGFRETTASAAFLDALRTLEERLANLLEDEERRRAQEHDRNLAREIRRVFRQVARVLPQYDLFDVRGQGVERKEPSPEGATVGHQDGDADGTNGVADPAAGAESEEPAAAVLFPPGPLVSVRITPARSRVLVDTERTLRARALDQQGVPAAGTVGFRWRLDGPGTLIPDGHLAVFRAPDHTAAVTVHVLAEADGRTAEAQADVKVLEDLEGGDRASGIPEPVAVHAPTEDWRSRVVDRRWEYNTGHKDYVAACAVESRRLRYLLHLFAKEVVVRNFPQPGAGELLERMVEVLTYLGHHRLPGLRPSATGGGREARASESS